MKPKKDPLLPHPIHLMVIVHEERSRTTLFRVKLVVPPSPRPYSSSSQQIGWEIIYTASIHIQIIYLHKLFLRWMMTEKSQYRLEV